MPIAESQFHWGLRQLHYRHLLLHRLRHSGHSPYAANPCFRRQTLCWSWSQLGMNEYLLLLSCNYPMLAIKYTVCNYNFTLISLYALHFKKLVCEWVYRSMCVRVCVVFCFSSVRGAWAVVFVLHLIFCTFTTPTLFARVCFSATLAIKDYSSTWQLNKYY